MTAVGLFFGAVIVPHMAKAGPPFLTDDPEPVDYQHFELNFFTQTTSSKSGTSGILPGLDANYGLLPDVQVHIMGQIANGETDGRQGLAGANSNTEPYGLGDVELGVKYRFINPGEEDWWPQVAVYPLLEVPTGNASGNLTTGHVQEFFPLWLQKDFGPWQTYGGGGYWNSPGGGNKNYWFFGWTLQRKITDDLTLGGEVFHETANTVGGPDNTGFDLGGSYDFTEDYHLLFSAGRGIQNATDTNQFSYYLAFQWTF